MAKNDFTYLRILKELPLDRSTAKPKRMVEAVCILCNSKVVVRKTRITGLEQSSCGCSVHLKPKPYNDVTGHEVNGITFIGYTSNGSWKVLYKCGHTGISEKYRVEGSRTGLCQSCAQAIPTTTTHGMSSTYNSWSMLKRRCSDENNNRFEYYGGKGIGVCERWLESFENFLEDMGVAPVGYSIERLNLELDYGPDNCVWASDITQANNKTNNILIKDIEETTWSLRRWCDILGLDYKAAWHRLRNKGEDISSILGEGYTVVQLN